MPRIKKGDTVAVISGKDKGKSGKVLQVWPVAQKVLVERINLVKHFERRSQQNPSGGVVEREGALAIAKLAIVCPKCKKPSRIGWQVGEGSKQRVCRRCKATIDSL
jgi:large subunit ribosomal protein L24